MLLARQDWEHSIALVNSPDYPDKTLKDLFESAQEHFYSCRKVYQAVIISAGEIKISNDATLLQTAQSAKHVRQRRTYLNSIQRIIMEQSFWCQSPQFSATCILTKPLTALQLRVVLLSSLKVLSHVTQNINFLRTKGFMNSFFSYLIKDSFRKSVARLECTQSHEVDRLRDWIQTTLEFKGLQVNDSTMELSIADAEHISRLFESCPLTQTQGPLLGTVHLIERFECLLDTCRMLDLALISYSAAFRGDVLEECKNTKLRLRLHSLADAANNPVSLQRRHLTCLNPMLREDQVWVFLPPTDQGSFHLSAGISSLADIWGPCWEVRRDPEGPLVQLNIGNGCIVPWKNNDEISLLLDERLCHWLPYNLSQEWSLATEGGLEAEPPEELPDTPENIHHYASFACSEPFSSDDRLLIAANSDELQCLPCGCESTSMIREFQNRGRLSVLGTKRLLNFIDTKQVSLVGGAHGVSVGASLHWKQIGPRTVKDELKEAWEYQPETRHPRLFKALWGVEVSLCTLNARRVSLWDLLKSSSIQELVKRYPWPNQNVEEIRAKGAFQAAMACDDYRDLFRLWEDQRRWVKEYGKVLLVCMRALFKTGLDYQRGEFNLFWMAPSNVLPNRAVLATSEQTWTSVLEDTPTGCTMAVLRDECFRFSDSTVSPSCKCVPSEARKSSSSVLETSLHVSPNLGPTLGLKVEDYGSRPCSEWRTLLRPWGQIWNVSKVKRGTRVWLPVTKSTMFVQDVPSSYHLRLKRKRTTRTNGFWQILLGTEEDGHWEYMGDEETSIRPLPIHIQ